MTIRRIIRHPEDENHGLGKDNTHINEPWSGDPTPSESAIYERKVNVFWQQELNKVAAQLADARAALGEISSIGDTDPYAAYSRCRCPGDTDDARESAQFELGEIARKVLAAPAPRADLIAAGMALAAAYEKYPCGSCGGYVEVAAQAYRAAKEATRE